MLAVVDSSQDNLVIVKIVLRDANDLDERNYNIYNNLTQSSEWQVVRICSLDNFNKAYVGVLGLEQCPLKDILLDLNSARPNSEMFPISNTLKKDSEKMTGYSLNTDQVNFLKSC